MKSHTRQRRAMRTVLWHPANLILLSLSPVVFALQSPFSMPSRLRLRSSNPSRTRRDPCRPLRYGEGDGDVESMRAEIEALRKRALERLDEVTVKAEEVLSKLPVDKETTLDEEKRILGLDRGGRRRSNRHVNDSATVKGNHSTAEKDDLMATEEERKVGKAVSRKNMEKQKILEKESFAKAKIDLSSTVHAGDRPLEGTYWKIMLNIGREPGTWMPKDWGVSGDRLLLQFQVQFRSDQLQEREDFLGGLGGSRVCHVIANDAVFGPSMTQSARHVRFCDGGWRIAQGEGPMGTDLLRFYVDLEEQVERGDVYCPAGRVYCTCGYFDISHRGHSRKVDIQRKLDDLADQYNNLLDERNEEGLFSLKRVKIWQEMVQTQMDIEKANKMMNDFKVMEPDLSLLRLSRRRDIGLTREGGVCCKVQKGPAGFYEYHILGRFEAASVEHGE
eukprot:CAMPEP_0183318426 /NCGR_PEP_ID=MMETSP0160_2-20130417/60688_1 /TAXON_ID=2839 ORGANISM="Odontella Sinensis, Strain Grunow 1884" /NCGR_SAMPLE_ID=MMETSP0160_2 /ASSEMBLY_ACC=CAM_ASM_000250 /LENGTH=445 /DNA_ID=CAMNT_0025484683 /DNA_START=23 /DNA_END=1357 /DNA_ORIENTATION=+